MVFSLLNLDSQTLVHDIFFFLVKNYKDEVSYPNGQHIQLDILLYLSDTFAKKIIIFLENFTL